MHLETDSNPIPEIMAANGSVGVEKVVVIAVDKSKQAEYAVNCKSQIGSYALRNNFCLF